MAHSQWLGFMVSITCADNKGTYQGEITAVTDAKITLSKAFCNGIPCPGPEIAIQAWDIIDLKLLEKQKGGPAGRSTITIAKPVAKRAGRTQSTSENTSNVKNNQNGSTNNNNKSKPIDIQQPRMTGALAEGYKGGTPNKRDRGKNKWGKSWKDEACFGSPLDDQISKDFDFEKMLALFDKQAVWDEINSQKPDVLKHTDQSKGSTKYRHDENVIATAPTTLRQILVPRQEVCEYVTDDGLVVPSVSRLLRTRLFMSAERVGISWERRSELMARAATEMALQLLGGGHRLNPNNSHQMPIVVFLCGPNRQGSMGINTARQLASHGVHTVVFVPTTDSDYIKKELALYRLTRNRVITDVSHLPNITDLIIVALCEESDNIKLYTSVAEWAKKNKASILALDPPAMGTPGIPAKFSLVPVLPLPHSSENGKIYLCNLGFPLDVFTELQITYRSPFGSKFVIPLHPSEDV